MTTATAKDAASKEMEVRDALSSLTEFSEILDYFAQQGVDVSDNKADAIRSLTVVENKDSLIGVPFLIIQWRFNMGTWGDFVSCEIAFETGEIVVLNDGSSGICQQLAELTKHRESIKHPTPMAGRMVKGGLRRSDYTYTDEHGKETPAHTYYLAF